MAGVVQVTAHPRLARCLRWALVGVLLSGVLVQALWGVLDRSSLLLLALSAYVAVGVVVSQRRPENPVGWLFLLVGGFTGLSGWANGLIAQAVTEGTPDVWYGVVGAWIEAWFWFPLITIATLFTVMLFPDGLLSPRWRPLLWVSIGAVGLITVGAALAPTLLVSTSGGGPEVPNPISPGWDSNSFDLAAAVLGLATVGCGVGALVEAVLRTRRARGIERQQMLWFAFAAGIALVWMALGMVVWQHDTILREVVFTLVIAFIPVSCGIAIMRYHLYDIDRVISRTTAYAIVTGLVLGTYFVVVTLLTHWMPVSSDLAVAAATLSAAAVVRPVLERVQAGVDRRFNRSRYDARLTLDAFGEELQQETDVDAITRRLLAVVVRSVEPMTVSVWQR